MRKFGHFAVSNSSRVENGFVGFSSACLHSKLQLMSPEVVQSILVGLKQCDQSGVHHRLLVGGLKQQDKVTVGVYGTLTGAPITVGVSNKFMYVSVRNGVVVEQHLRPLFGDCFVFICFSDKSFVMGSPELFDVARRMELDTVQTKNTLMPLIMDTQIESGRQHPNSFAEYRDNVIKKPLAVLVKIDDPFYNAVNQVYLDMGTMNNVLNLVSHVPNKCEVVSEIAPVPVEVKEVGDVVLPFQQSSFVEVWPAPMKSTINASESVGSVLAVKSEAPFKSALSLGIVPVRKEVFFVTDVVPQKRKDVPDLQRPKTKKSRSEPEAISGVNSNDSPLKKRSLSGVSVFSKPNRINVEDNIDI